MPTIFEHLFDIFQCVFFQFMFVSMSLKIFFHTFYVHIIDVERRGVFSFIMHLKSHIFRFIFVFNNLLILRHSIIFRNS